MTHQQTTKVIGALTLEERAVIDERDGYREKFFAAKTDEEQREWMGKIQDANTRYDALRTARWQRSEVN